MTATKETFFKPEKVSPQDKAATTDSVARSLIAQEATARERKTETLKALRMQREALEAEQAPVPKKRAVKKAVKRG